MATRSKPAKASKKSAAIKVDFEGVESGGGTPAAEGDHIIEVEEVERKTNTLITTSKMVTIGTRRVGMRSLSGIMQRSKRNFKRIE